MRKRTNECNIINLKTMISWVSILQNLVILMQYWSSKGDHCWQGIKIQWFHVAPEMLMNHHVMSRYSWYHYKFYPNAHKDKYNWKDGCNPKEIWYHWRYRWYQFEKMNTNPGLMGKIKMNTSSGLKSKIRMNISSGLINKIDMNTSSGLINDR